MVDAGLVRRSTKPEIFLAHGREHLRGVEPAMDSLLTKVVDTSNAELHPQVIRSIGAAHEARDLRRRGSALDGSRGCWQTPRDAVIDALDGDLRSWSRRSDSST